MFVRTCSDLKAVRLSLVEDDSAETRLGGSEIVQQDVSADGRDVLEADQVVADGLRWRGIERDCLEGTITQLFVVADTTRSCLVEVLLGIQGDDDKAGDHDERCQQTDKSILHYPPRLKRAFGNYSRRNSEMISEL